MNNDVTFFLSNREITEAREIIRKPIPRNSLESAEYVTAITGLLNAKDFRDRINGIKQLFLDTENNQDLIVANIIKVIIYKNTFFERPDSPWYKVSIIVMFCSKDAQCHKPWFVFLLRKCDKQGSNRASEEEVRYGLRKR